MKAISLWQPWATLIAIGAKRIETRSWDTLYRGPLAIHASLKLVKEVATREPFVGALHDGGYLNTKDLPLGAIVAVCEIRQTFQVERQTLWPDGWITDMTIPPAAPELHFGDYRPGRFAWLLSDIRPLARPLPWRGGQRFFNVPDDAINNLIPQEQSK